MLLRNQSWDHRCCLLLQLKLWVSVKTGCRNVLDPSNAWTRHDCCRTVSACESFPWKRRDLGIPAMLLASCHQTLTSLTKFFVSLFLLVQASHFFCSHTDQWAGPSGKFPLKSICQGKMSFWQNKTFREICLFHGIYYMFLKICSIKFFLAEALHVLWWGDDYLQGKLRLKNVLAWFVFTFSLEKIPHHTALKQTGWLIREPEYPGKQAWCPSGINKTKLLLPIIKIFVAGIKGKGG